MTKQSTFDSRNTRFLQANISIYCVNIGSSQKQTQKHHDINIKSLDWIHIINR